MTKCGLKTLKKSVEVWKCGWKCGSLEVLIFDNLTAGWLEWTGWLSAQAVTQHNLHPCLARREKVPSEKK